jgi:hypothetical protein
VNALSGYIDNVSFDHAAAATAAATCRATARQLDALAELRERGATRALHQWTGPFAERFVDVHADIQARSRDQRDRLLLTAADIEQIAQAARQEQARRDRHNAEVAAVLARRWALALQGATAPWGTS